MMCSNVPMTMSNHFLCRSIYENHILIVVYTGTISLMMLQIASSQNHSIMPRNVKEEFKNIPVLSVVMKKICVDICSLSNEDRSENLIACIDYFSKWFEAKLIHDKSTSTAGHSLDHDKMILCLVAVHASIFNTSHQAFFLLNQRMQLFFVLPANIFGNFLFDSPSFINTNFDVRNS